MRFDDVIGGRISVSLALSHGWLEVSSNERLVWLFLDMKHSIKVMYGEVWSEWLLNMFLVWLKRC